MSVPVCEIKHLTHCGELVRFSVLDEKLFLFLVCVCVCSLRATAHHGLFMQLLRDVLGRDQQCGASVKHDIIATPARIMQIGPLEEVNGP